MADQKATEGTFHVLLIGVDNYPRHLLRGCVNDIDAMKQILLDSGLGITPESIRILASPLPEAQRKPLDGEQPATMANIRNALADLASARVKPDHRIFIYYSGHGKRVPVVASNGCAFQREALVPTDFEHADGTFDWLFDYEVNQALRAITQKTRSVAVVLDCCHAAGAFREGDDPNDGVRSLEGIELVPVPDPAGARRALDNDAAWLGQGVEACHVVSACLAQETSRETTVDGVRHGLLTRALVAALRATPPAARPTITWGQIWHSVRTEVMKGNPRQTPRMEGNPGRCVFAGPPVERDAGIPVTFDADTKLYRLAAGKMAEIEKGAKLAIYGPEPAYFPKRNSDADHAARLGVVRVTAATPGDAEAVAVESPFRIPLDARARLIEPVLALRCSVRPESAEIAQLVAGSSLIELVGPTESAPLRLELHDGRWLLVDDQHGNGKDAPVLFALGPAQLDSVRAVLEHYHAYSLPIRMAKRAAADLRDGLELRLLDCPDELEPARAQALDLSESPTENGMYRVPANTGVCVYVRNRSSCQLKVALFNAASEGEVQALGDEMLEPGGFHVFWAGSNLGAPYKLRLADDVDRARDRLIAIGRTSVNYELDYLKVEQTFADIVARGDRIDDGADKRLDDGVKAATTERWTATQAILEIYQR